MGSENLHEPYDLLQPATRDLHRAIVSLIEELDAVDWYTQRAEAAEDQELRDVLLHHREEEIEHAMMNLEWIRRRVPDVAEKARTYLFSEIPITAIEEAAEHGEGAAAAAGAASDGSLGIGSLKLP